MGEGGREREKGEELRWREGRWKGKREWRREMEGGRQGEMGDGEREG